MDIEIKLQHNTVLKIKISKKLGYIKEYTSYCVWEEVYKETATIQSLNKFENWDKFISYLNTNYNDNMWRIKPKLHIYEQEVSH